MFKINKRRLSTHIISIIVWIQIQILDFFIIIDFSIKPFADSTSVPRGPDVGRDVRLGTTDLSEGTLWPLKQYTAKFV